jgi:hypothetical protein
MGSLKFVAGGLLLCLLASCTGQPGGGIDAPLQSERQEPPAAGQLHGQLDADTEIPQDSLLPWEELNADGFVDPATARMSSAINENSEFWRGVDALLRQARLPRRARPCP